MRRAFRILAAALATAIIIVVATVALSLVFILAGFSGTASFPVDCGLVFGAAISGRNTPGPAIVRRVDGAAALWKNGDVRTLIFTGGKGDSWRLSEAVVMRQQAIRDGVDGRSIFTEESARSTKENIENSLFLVKEHCQTVVAISDQYHLARIRLLAKQAGWGTLMTYGVPERPDARGESRSVLREFAAYAYYAFGADTFLSFDEYDDVVPHTASGASGRVNTP